MTRVTNYAPQQDEASIGLGSPAGGDTSGTFPNPTVIGVGGKPIDDLPPTVTGDVIVFNAVSGHWEVRLLGPTDVGALAANGVVLSGAPSGAGEIIISDGPSAAHWQLLTPTTATVTPLSGAFSSPPTEAELEAAIGTPAGLTGAIYFLLNTSSGLHYFVLCDGTSFHLAPTVLASGVPSTNVFALTAAPDGGWPGFAQSPQHGGYTYLAYCDNSGNNEVRVVTNSTLAVGAAILVGGPAVVDWHNAPSFMVRSSDHRLVIAECSHDAPDLYIRISTNSLDTDPALSGGFGAAVDISGSLGGVQDFTYPRLFELTSEGKLYLFYSSLASGKRNWCVSTSSDNGATWSARTVLFQNTGHDCYMAFDSNGTDRIDFVTTNGSAASEHANVYAAYYTGGAYYRSDGTAIGHAPTFAPADFTLVYSGASAGARYVSSVATNGGNPVATFPVQPGGAEDYVYAAYADGWTSHTIVNAGHSGDPWIEGGLGIDPAAPATVYLSRYISSHWEMYRYTTADAGVSWSAVPLTSASPSHNIYPVVIRNGATEVKAIWLVGTATSSTSFSFGISGASG